MNIAATRPIQKAEYKTWKMYKTSPFYQYILFTKVLEKKTVK